MVSWDTWRSSSSGYVRLSQPATLVGRPQSRSFSATRRANTPGSCASLQRLAAPPDRQAAGPPRSPGTSTVTVAADLPPTVIGARARRSYRAHSSDPASTPREISSRSESDSARSERTVAVGRMPPVLPQGTRPTVNGGDQETEHHRCTIAPPPPLPHQGLVRLGVMDPRPILHTQHPPLNHESLGVASTDRIHSRDRRFPQLKCPRSIGYDSD